MTASPSSSTTTSRFRIGGMDCASCASKIDTAVRRIEGVEDVSVSVTAGTLTVHHEVAAAPKAAIAKMVTALGYTITEAPARAADAHEHGPGHKHGLDYDRNPSAPRAQQNASDGHSHDHGAPFDGPWWQTPKAKLTLACGAALAVAYLIAKALPVLGTWPYVAAMAIGLIPIAQRAFQAARAGTPFSIEMLMTIAAVGAVFIGAAEEAAAVVLLFLIGELLEGVATGRARASIRALTSLVPNSALLEKDGTTHEVSADSLSIGVTILVRPGDLVPADGTFLSGESSIRVSPGLMPCS